MIRLVEYHNYCYVYQEAGVAERHSYAVAGSVLAIASEERYTHNLDNWFPCELRKFAVADCREVPDKYRIPYEKLKTV